MKIEKIIFLILFLLTHNYLFSQSFFSQFYSSPLTINPANTGEFFGDYRIGGLYRSEKNSSGVISKATFYYDGRILPSTLPEYDKLAIGTAFLSEKDIFNGIKNSYFLVSVAYHKSLDEEGLQQLGAGFQANYSTKKIEPPVLIFEDQLRAWINSGFSTMNPFIKRININYIDINAGLNYQGLINKNLLNVGISVLHANRPSRSFDGGEFSLSPQPIFHIGLESPIANKNKLYSAFIISAKNKKVDELYFSCIYQVKINESNYKISSGVLFRKSTLNGNAIIPTLGMKFNNFLLNMAYDINVSSRTNTQKGALEVGMIFIGRKVPKK
ncbi:MAG: type IX secretion system membrane protein PorP/SprF [Chitinophagaceae bacterium]